MTNLLDAWSKWSEASVPYVLEEDKEVLNSIRSTKSTVAYKSWAEVYKSKDFAAPGDTRLHLGLLPHPFCGDVENAEIYILMLNPGYGPHDYFGEFEVPEYRKAVLANLKQSFTSETLPFFLLDPQFSWHGGFNWWHGKFAGVINKLAQSKGMSFAEARAELARKIASIELLPYHSTSFRDGDHWIRDLHSVKLAREYVKGHVLPRVASDKAIAIVTRQASVWNLPEHSGVIRYSGQQARAAHLSPSSPGGKAILEHII
jgi:hypothetical protein